MRYKKEKETQQKRIDSLEAILKKQNDDSAYFKIAMEFLNDQKYYEAFTRFTDFKNKFPNSNLILIAESNLKICKEHIEKEDEENLELLNLIIVNTKPSDLENTIKILKGIIESSPS